MVAPASLSQSSAAQPKCASAGPSVSEGSATRPVTTTSAPGSGNRRLLEKAAFLGPGLLFTLVFVAVPLLLVLSYTVFERGRFGGVLYEFNLDNFTRALELCRRAGPAAALRAGVLRLDLASLAAEAGDVDGARGHIRAAREVADMPLLVEDIIQAREELAALPR